MLPRLILEHGLSHFGRRDFTQRERQLDRVNAPLVASRNLVTLASRSHQHLKLAKLLGEVWSVAVVPIDDPFGGVAATDEVDIGVRPIDGPNGFRDFNEQPPIRRRDRVIIML